MQFLGIKWDNQLKSPLITYKNNPKYEDEQYLPITTGKNLTIRVGSSRYCIGNFTHPDYKRSTCTNNSLLFDGSQCSYCKSKDSTYFLPINSLKYEQIEILKEQPHLNYINIFGNNLFKTGVAAKVRHITRLLEQGAIATIFFADADGLTSRQIESHISKTLNIKQALTWDTKIRYIQVLPDKEKAYTELKALYDQIASNISDMYRRYLIKDPEFLYNYEYYSLSLPKSVNKIRVISEFSENDILSGFVIGIYGEIILLKQDNNDIYALNTKGLQGFLFEPCQDTLPLQLLHEPKSIELHKMQFENLSLF